MSKAGLVMVSVLPTTPIQARSFMRNVFQKKAMIGVTLSLAFLICLLTLAESVRATSLSVTDSTLSPGNPIDYELNFSRIGPTQTFDATFSITNFAIVSPNWWADWFLFKFDGSDGAVIDVSSAPSGVWSVLNPGDIADI